jgi:hypothetical protein
VCFTVSLKEEKEQPFWCAKDSAWPKNVCSGPLTSQGRLLRFCSGLSQPASPCARA